MMEYITAKKEQAIDTHANSRGLPLTIISHRVLSSNSSQAIYFLLSFISKTNIAPFVQRLIELAQINTSALI